MTANERHPKRIYVRIRIRGLNKDVPDQTNGSRGPDPDRRNLSAKGKLQRNRSAIEEISGLPKD